MSDENEVEAKNDTKQEEEELTLKDKILESLLDMCYWSSCSAVMQGAMASNWPLRVMWIVLFLTGLGAALYFVIISFIGYFQYGVLNQIYMAKEFPTYFPAVTICNLNPFNNNRSSVYIDTLLAANNLSDFISVTNTDALEQSQGSNNTIQLLDDLLDKLRRWVATDANLTEASRRNLGFEMKKEMLLSCSFNGISCSDTDFRYSRSYKYGNCFTYNSGFNSAGTKVDLLQTSKTGDSYGLTMEIMVGNPLDEVRFTYKSGIYLLIHNQSFSPLEIFDDGTFVPTGSDSYVSIERKFNYALASPFSTCIDDFSTPPNDYAKKLFAYMSDTGATVYSTSYCSNICYQDQVIDKCGCADPVYPKLRNAVYCTSTSQISCQVAFLASFSSANLAAQCNSGCPDKCSSVTYDMSQTNSMYPSSFYQGLMATKTEFNEVLDNLDSIAESLVKVTINYESLQYQVIQETPQTSPEDLLGNIGGQFGLFIGLSFLSFFEIVHVIMDLIRILYQHYKKKRAVNPVV